jgi:hypothetical protein
MLHRTDGVGHRRHRQPESQRDRHHADRQGRAVAADGDGSAADENKWRKIYEKPTLLKRDALPLVAAAKSAP